MSDERDGYQAYLLRLWRVPSQGRWQWRASLESRHTGEHLLFAGLRQLFAYLTERCESQMPPMTETRGT
jgi:Ser-tRNA(Ala) deacylase AlaX